MEDGRLARLVVGRNLLPRQLSQISIVQLSSPRHRACDMGVVMQRRYEYRRKLPHYQPDHKAFFITFSTRKRWILPELVRGIVIETCLAGNGKKFDLFAVVVMPDHVHLILSPIVDANGPASISEIMQAIKGVSAHRINQALGRKGRVWEEESFDRALRREESIVDKVEYILGNPVGAGLVSSPLEYRWTWRKTGARQDA
jgi:putative transposase